MIVRQAIAKSSAVYVIIQGRYFEVSKESALHAFTEDKEKQIREKFSFYWIIKNLFIHEKEKRNE